MVLLGKFLRLSGKSGSNEQQVNFRGGAVQLRYKQEPRVKDGSRCATNGTAGTIQEQVATNGTAGYFRVASNHQVQQVLQEQVPTTKWNLQVLQEVLLQVNSR